MHKVKRFYLKVGGFNFVCVLRLTEHGYPNHKFAELLENEYSDFFSKKVSRPDFTLDFNTTGVVNFNSKKTDLKDMNAYFFHLFSFDKKKRRLYFDHPVGQFEFEFIINTLMSQYLLPSNNGFNLHGSAVVYGDNAYLFEGVSGAGKSTTSQLLKGLCDILSDGSLVVRKEKNKFYAYETIIHDKKWNFKRLNKGFPVKKVFFVRKSDNCSVEEIKNKTFVLQKFLRRVFAYEGKLSTRFKLIAEFVSRTDFYYIYVKKDGKIFKDFFKKEILRI